MPKLSGFASLATLPEERVTDKISRKIAAGDQEMIVWWSIKAGAHAAAHKHPHEQISWMLKGNMEFRLGDERRSCGPGDVVVIPGGVEHEGFFPEDSEVIDVFSPPREDFLAGGVPVYMKVIPPRGYCPN
jgi:quercetin dioxygenase-like cupin family protein